MGDVVGILDDTGFEQGLAVLFAASRGELHDPPRAACEGGCPARRVLGSRRARRRLSGVVNEQQNDVELTGQGRELGCHDAHLGIAVFVRDGCRG